MFEKSSKTGKSQRPGDFTPERRQCERKFLACHPERSEGSVSMGRGVIRYTQSEKFILSGIIQSPLPLIFSHCNGPDEGSCNGPEGGGCRDPDTILIPIPGMEGVCGFRVLARCAGRV